MVFFILTKMINKMFWYKCCSMNFENFYIFIYIGIFQYSINTDENILKLQLY